MLWVTRAGGNVDRVACPWLIKRHIDRDAQFLYVPAEKVLELTNSKSKLVKQPLPQDDPKQRRPDIAQAKARSAARFKRPTKAFQDALAAGGEGWRILSLEGAVAVDGGIPLTSGGKIVGAIGASGGTSQQDGVTAAAGAATLK